MLTAILHETLTYEAACQLPVIATVSRPDGYFGARCQVRLALFGERLLEIHAAGYHVCPAIQNASSADEVLWLLDHHPNFREYHVA